MNKIVKGLMATGVLVLSCSAVFFSSQPVAQNGFLEVLGCEGDKGICTDITKQASFANQRAKIHAQKALVGGSSAPISIVIQSDALNTAIRFNYQAFEDEVWVEGPNGQDINYTTTQVSFKSSETLQGTTKIAVENAVSTRANTLRVAKAYNIPLTANNDINANVFCKLDDDMPVYNAARIAERCASELVSTGAIDSALNTLEIAQSATSSLSWRASVSAEFRKIFGGEAGIEHTQEDGRNVKVTTLGNNFLKFDFTRPEGNYIVILKPNKDTIADVVALQVPPNQDVPVDKRGNIDLPQLEEDLGTGGFKFDSSSEGFLKRVRRVANRKGASSLSVKLGSILALLSQESGITITELPEQKTE